MKIKKEYREFIKQLVDLGYAPVVYQKKYRYNDRVRPKSRCPVILIGTEEEEWDKGQGYKRVRIWFKNKKNVSIGLYHTCKSDPADLSGLLNFLKNFGYLA